MPMCFAGIQKLDKNGRHVDFTFSQMFDDGPVTLGWLRVSHRELDEERSRPRAPGPEARPLAVAAE